MTVLLQTSQIVEQPMQKTLFQGEGKILVQTVCVMCFMNWNYNLKIHSMFKCVN